MRTPPLDSAIDRPSWFGPIEQVIVPATAYLDRLFDETERILGEYPVNCRCQRQLRPVDEKDGAGLKEWRRGAVAAEVAACGR